MSRHRANHIVGLVVFLLSLGTAATAAEWQPNTFYAVDTFVTYQGPSYKCIQAHTSQVGWEPPNTPALWQLSTPTATPTATPRATPTPRSTPTPRTTSTPRTTATPRT